MTHIIGITGNIACGKTAIGKMLLELGAERYIDTDALVHQLYERGQPIAVQVGENFGPHILAADGSVDRKALGAIVFQHPEELRRLEKIVHPAVTIAVRKELDAVSSDGIAMIDAVKLLEGGSAALCESKWLITCNEEQQRQRLMQRNHLDAAEVDARIRAQPDSASRMKLVDEIIDNSGSLEETRPQVEEAFKRFQKNILTR